jgi:hypothetical protein
VYTLTSTPSRLGRSVPGGAAVELPATAADGLS